jgi:hypothetical protein
MVTPSVLVSVDGFAVIALDDGAKAFAEGIKGFF